MSDRSPDVIDLSLIPMPEFDGPMHEPTEASMLERPAPMLKLVKETRSQADDDHLTALLRRRLQPPPNMGGNPGGSALLPLPSPEIVNALQGFQDISLEETNDKASMLKRVDNKYIANKTQLIGLLEQLKHHFQILRIDQRGIFSYESCYFDDDIRCYHEHRKGKRKRFKVRTRRYVDSDASYFEVKLKGNRGQTEKSRMKCDDFYSYTINGHEHVMLKNLYENNYSQVFDYQMKPTLHVSYRRFTLVSITGSERMTIDLNLGFETPTGKKAHINDDFIIIETKTADGRGKSDLVMKQAGIRPAEGCSKYCLGMVLTNEAQKYNQFRRIIKSLRARLLELGYGEEQSAPLTARYAT